MPVRIDPWSRIASAAMAALAAFAAFALLAAFCAPRAAAQAPCGAAGGAPAGASPTVCDFAREAVGLPPLGAATSAGNPLDLVTGNEYRHELDLRMPSPPPVVFARHYNSRNRHAGPLGTGWSHSHEARLARVRTGGRDTVQLVQGDGRRLVFEAVPGRPGRWRTHDPLEGRLVAALAGADGGWVWRRAGGEAVRFDDAGRLLRVERDGAVVLRLERDDAGRIVTVDGRARGVLRIAYLEHRLGARIARVATMPEGDAIAYEYDDAGQLAAVAFPDGRRREYAYDDPNDPLLLTEVRERDVEPGATPRVVARYAYDAQGRAVATTDRDGTALRIAHRAPVRRGGVGETTVTDAAGRVARYRWTYDRLRHVARMLVSEGVACESCPPAPRRHRWDAHGRLAGVDGPQGTLHIARDAAGRPVTLRHAAPGSRAGTLLARLRWPDADALDWHRLEQPSVAPGRLHRITIARDASGRVVAVDERGWAPVPAARAGAAWAPLARRYTLGHRDPPDDEPDPDAARSLMLSGLAWVDGPEPGEADRIGIEQVGLDELRLTHPGGRLEVLRFTDRLLAEHRTPTGLHARMRHAVAAHQWLGGPTLLGAFVGHAQLDLDYAPFGELAGVVLHRFERRETITVTGEEPTAGAQMRALAFHRGRPSAIALADGAVLRRGFDDFGRVAWIDEPGAPRQWARHDASDRLVEHRLGDGHVLHHRRDTAGRLVETVRDGPAGREVLGRYRWEGTHLAEAANDTVSIRYGHDRLGRPEWVEHVFADAPGTPLRWRWHYDLAGRVAVEELPGGLVVRHEHAGREIVALEVEGLAAGPVRLDVAALHEPLALRDRDPVSPATTAAAAVDAATTVPAAPVHAGTRLLEAGGMRHLQDPHGRRAAKRAIDRSQAKQDRAWVHDDWRVRAERTHNGRLRHWLWAGARPVAMVEDGRLLRVVTDARGAPVRALEADGTQAWAASYDRDGEARVEIERLRIDLRLPGQVHDPETGLHHHHWRTYDPRAGRYLERDPLGLQPGWRGRADLRAYAGGDPVGRSDPWGLATLTWYALTTGADGRPLGRTQGFDRARWSFIVEDILPVPLAGAGHARPQPAGIDGLLFDPWGDFVGRADDPGAGRGNGLDAIAWSGATGRTITAAFAAHYGGLLGTMQRFVVEGFDDRRAGALATILAGSPSQRASCVRGVLESLPGFSTAPAERLARPALGDFPAARGPSEALAGPPANPGGPLRLLACEGGGGALPVDWRDALERDRVARYQAAAELQESPSASLGEDCAASRGCRSRARVAVNGRSYWASYGRTQFTVATFLAELVRLASPAAGAEAAALRAAIGFDAPVAIDGRPTTVGEAIGLARRRVDAAYRAFATLRAEFGRGLDAVRAGAAWDALPTARRAAFVADTGLGRDAFVDVLGFVATPADGRTEEEGRHAIAASAAATVAWSASATGGAAADALDWLVALFASRDAYDHVSRTFLRDNLRRVLAAPQLAGRFDNLEPAGTPAWDTRQQAIELDLARRVAVLHNAGRLELATRPELEAWLAANGGHWVAGYVAQFTRADTRGNWDALRCSASLAAGGALQLARLEAMPSGTAPPPRPGPSRRVLAQ